MQALSPHLLTGLYNQKSAFAKEASPGARALAFPARTHLRRDREPRPGALSVHTVPTGDLGKSLQSQSPTIDSWQFDHEVPRGPFSPKAEAWMVRVSSIAAFCPVPPNFPRKLPRHVPRQDLCAATGQTKGRCTQRVAARAPWVRARTKASRAENSHREISNSMNSRSRPCPTQP